MALQGPATRGHAGDVRDTPVSRPASGSVSAPAMTENLSAWIDVFRWIAAGAVVIAHGGNRFVAAIHDVPPEAREKAHVLFTFLMGFSHPGIMVFFVISGFLVGGTSWREVQRTGRIDLGRFLSRRLVRLWIVIIPALVLTLAFDSLGMSLSGVPAAVYDRGGAPPALGIGTFLCNVAFLQTVACPTYGTNGALWTLFNEFWYYLVAIALLLYEFRRPTSTVFKGACALFAAAIMSVGFLQCETGALMPPYFLIWCLGMFAAAADRPLPFVSPGQLLAAVLVLLVGFRVATGMNLWANEGLVAYAFDVVSMTLFAAFLLQLRFRSLWIPRPFARASVLLASFTFTIYCVHVPLMNVMAAIGEHVFGFGYRDAPSGALFWLRIVGQFAFVFLFAAAAAQLTEARTDGVRAWLTDRLAGLKGPRPEALGQHPEKGRPAGRRNAEDAEMKPVAPPVAQRASGPSTAPAAHRGKIEGLEILRFLLAFGVMVYHYLYYGPISGVIPLMGDAHPLLVAGRFGVSAFFIISGFVIIYSAANRSAGAFALARFSRLAPALVIASTFTMAVLVVWPEPLGLPSLSSYAKALSTVGLLAGGKAVDGSYWSITIELRFYLYVFIVLLVLRNLDRLKLLVTLWIVASIVAMAAHEALPHMRAVSAFRIATLSPHSGFFILGILYYLWRMRGEHRFVGLLILPALLLASWQGYEEFEHVDMLDGVRAPAWVGIAIAAVSFGLVIGFAFNIANPLASRVARRLGAMSYPLYLVHQAAGYSLIVHLCGIFGWGAAPVVAAAVMALMVLVAYLISAYWEPFGRSVIDAVAGFMARRTAAA